VARGTAHLRSHVDIDLEGGLLKLDGVPAVRERHRGRASVQIVAFPQSGVMRCPGVLDLVDALEASDTGVSAGRRVELERDRCHLENDTCQRADMSDLKEAIRT
jgi:hypothetical protein